MAKKKLLSEAQVRKFMGLAKLDANMSSAFLSENWGEKEDEYKRHDVGGTEKKAGDEDGHYKDYMKEDEEMDAEEVSMDAEMPPMDDEMPPMEMDAEEEMMETSSPHSQISEEEIVQEVTRRVAKRINQAARAQKKANKLLGRSKK